VLGMYLHSYFPASQQKPIDLSLRTSCSPDQRDIFLDKCV